MQATDHPSAGPRPAGAPRWIVCQLGAREHYANARALHERGRLALLLTDIWVSRKIWRRWLPQFGTRFDARLQSVRVLAFNGFFLLVTALKRVVGSRRWQDSLTDFYDRAFQRFAASRLRPLRVSGEARIAVFAYSYSALRPFKVARSRGWLTVLGQINPGPREEEIVREIYRQEYGPDVPAPAAPAAYWQRWREECALADVVVVNSAWSQQLVVEAGIEAEKTAIVPLAYTPPAEAAGFRRVYPAVFTRERPLRVLFLGALHPRKGVHVLLRACAELASEGAPVEFLFVGRDEMPGGVAGRLAANTRLLPAVDRRSTGEHYRWADVFILPTLSDGFALTQLEAQAWRLPIIVSRRCGQVVRDGIDGILLPEVTVPAVSAAVRACADDALRLGAFASEIPDLEAYSLAAVGAQLEMGLSRAG